MYIKKNRCHRLNYINVFQNIDIMLISTRVMKINDISRMLPIISF